MDYISKRSFKFGNVDMWTEYGIRIRDDSFPEDVLLPTLRSRKMTIPNRSGAYDYGAKYHDERVLTIPCVTLKPADKYEARALLREITAVLNKKSQIRLWDEPDKYYIGRIYDAVPLNMVRNVGAEFDLSFVCEPYSYGETINGDFVNSYYNIQYKGTAAAPTRIEIVNTGDSPINGFIIIQNDKKETI